ncbi:sulfurtransferase [Stomatohabitans albus]|uniref:sulfurtransferase n=1 Tax=Stomatohabitans albus TaxID=3110766 RepID=UPI00300CAACD
MEMLVTVEWLTEHLDEVTCIDVRCGVSMPETRTHGIPGARTLNIDEEGSDQSSGLPHTMLSPQAFKTVLHQMGIHEGDTIVCYDGYGMFCAPRAWWMLRSAGIAAKVLNGGLPAWESAGHPTAPHQPNPGGGTISVPDALVGFTDMAGVQAALANPDTTVVDARATGRFEGTTPEPREGLTCGHMPGAINLPFTDLLEDGYLRPDASEYFITICGEPHPLVTSCGSGVTASLLAMVAVGAGYNDVHVYDGSWAEYGQTGLNLEIVQGT